MESAYTLALKELERIRNENRRTDEIHHSEVLEKAPEITDIENELMKNGTGLLKCVLNKGENFETIKQNIKNLQKKKAELLVKNGFPENYLDDTVTCAVCNDTGFKDGKRCVCHKMLIMKYISQNSNLTEYMRTQTFENFNFSLFKQQDIEAPGKNALKIATKLCEKASLYAENFDATGENLFIMGNSGTGKTFLSSCIANRALERGKSVYYQSAYKLFEMFENIKFHKASEEDTDEAVKYVYSVDLLIIDDIGTEFITQYTAATFFDIINSRINSKKSTIISTNLAFDDMEEIYGNRVTSRIYGEYTILPTLSEDLRRIIKNTK